jgi:NTP pyrophosphatase (non-canonical NTP hydrolase)
MAMTKWVPETNPMILRRVGKTGEECAELSKVCSRITIQGLAGVDPATGESNRQALQKEIADVVAQCYTTINALNLDDEAVRVRCVEKQRQMAEWEAMFTPQDPDAPFSPRPGDLVRYGDGSTALALHGDPHAGGWHGDQCMGGYTFYSKVYRPTHDDRLMWVQCAIKWRHVDLAQAMAEAGLPTPADDRREWTGVPA